jgi:ABC-type multidrug transport system ATPase subunit
MSVKETLTTAASFFASESADVKQRVDEAMTMLGLQDQANTKVGGLFYRGCSGGQKRRITVGELVILASGVCSVTKLSAFCELT